MFTIEIRGCRSEEKFEQLRDVVGDRNLRINAPKVFIDYPSRETAQMDLVILRLLPGITAHILQDHDNS